MKQITLMALLSLLGLFACKAYKDLSVEAFQKRLIEDDSVQLLDVRTPQEFAEGHIPGAINIDWKADGFLEAAKAALEAVRPVLVYCRSGRRSAEAAAAMEGIGFKV